MGRARSVLLAEELREDAAGRLGHPLALGQHLGLDRALAQRGVHVLDRDGVDAVALVGLREALALKHVLRRFEPDGVSSRRVDRLFEGSSRGSAYAKVTTAARAQDFDALHAHAAVRLRHHGALDDLVERGPAAAAVELRGGGVERL